MGAAAMAFFNAVSGVARQPLHPQGPPPPAAPAQSHPQGHPQGHPLAPPLGMGPVPGSRSARRHYQQQLQLQSNKQQQAKKQQQQAVVSVVQGLPVALPVGLPGPSRVPEEQPSPQALAPPAPNRCPCTVDEFLAPFRSKMKAFKKLRKRLATRSSSSTATNNLPPLAFHQIHGENIELCFDRRVARRTESFCKAVTFSNRPVLVGEKVYIRFLEISDSWSGVIRMGFTSYDPVTLSSAGLPRYACPDLTNKPGSWAKALSERFAVQGAVLYFYVTQTGDVHFGVNGEDKGFFFGDVETRGPLWAVVDVYGNSTAIELVDPRAQLNNSRRSLTGSTTGSDWEASPDRLASAMSGLRITPTPNAAPATLSAAPGHQGHSPSGQQHDRSGRAHVQGAARGHQGAHPGGHQGHHGHRHSHHHDDMLPSPRFQPTGAVFSFLAFHRTRGRNVVLNGDRTLATRPDTEFCHGYVFTQRPIVLGERIVIQVLNTEPAYVGALAFGLTSCDPATLSPGDLPEDADFLLDRSEYWVVSKDVASAPQRGDELTFSVTPNGEVTMSRNGSTPVVFMHVDHTLQLWAFMDVYGSTQRIRLLGTLLDPSLASSPHRASSLANQSAVDPHTANNHNNGRLCCAQRPPVPPHGPPHGVPTASPAPAPTAAAPAPVAAVPTAVTVVTPHPSPAHPAGATANSIGATAEVLQLAANGGTMLVVNLPPNPHTYLPGPAPVPALLGAAGEPSEPGASALSDNGFIGSVQQWAEQQQHGNTLHASECSICYERPIDSVLYMCGHMCMCYECAVQQWRGKGGGHCPMCRAVIRDVIRTYKS